MTASNVEVKPHPMGAEGLHEGQIDLTLRVEITLDNWSEFGREYDDIEVRVREYLESVDNFEDIIKANPCGSADWDISPSYMRFTPETTWRDCDACSGVGATDDGEECESCGGEAAFKVDSEGEVRVD